MRFTSVLALVASASAVAMPEPPSSKDARGWCPIRGQPCWKVKRAAEALTEALAVRADEGHPAVRAVGPAADHARRAVESLAAAVAAVTDDPEAYIAALYLDEAFPQGGDEDAAVEKRGPSAVDAVEERGWCPIRGQPCWKKTRRGEQEARGWCPIRGQPCWKAKRAAGAVIDAIGGANFAKREALPEAGWCPIRGQPCWKREEMAGLEARCFAEGGACAKAQRDLDAIYKAARSVMDEVQ
ncbi:uncharacterized protein E0L32_004234 [Thyridium curvatum]|uniref:Clock-controlled pheromone ccg-4 n=1 Tax=Thyridium curvatum TaxID=1093900 RepID=A0A507B8R4_9PEZI|nr:uncharacterized protein E0L32_004234 [Thyridium curvatum]TPX15536.1 hypothetical protein E0L32_004234 [Thyridium curvatum]